VAEPDLDRQFPPPNPGPVPASASHTRPGARVPALYAGRGGWMLRGACRSEDPELFFPISAAGPALAQVSSAKAVCGRCLVQPDCLSYALITRPDGIWGGTTREERRATPPARSGEAQDSQTTS
jgi:WhiB family transcriptional regulator, redox-sensing transcriptional regulator